MMIDQTQIQQSPWVTDLKSAYAAYHAARTRREEQAAHHEILLFGGADGYPDGPPWRAACARWARRFACWIEEER